ncbi:hypothetical protein SNE40_009506 [Patella caerulea]|uniref:Uncharacterized protein n=1 Tax=Patella caerulea TaxID=87958 RepID=A0AAN8JRD7_PATCE
MSSFTNGEPVIEQNIKEFIYSKTRECVFVDIQTTSSIKIVPKIKHGSIVLGILWVKVLQHHGNYPVTKYPYKKKIDSKSVYEIVLSLEDVVIIVNLKTGLLEIKGRFVIEWFTRYFQSVLNVYDGILKETCKPEKIYTEIEVKHLDRDIETNKQYYANNWPDEALKDGVSVFNVSSNVLTSVDSEVPLELQVPDEKDLDVMTQEEVDEQTSTLAPGSVLDGVTLHRIWRSLLNAWCSSENCSISIATPRIDVPSLVEICHFFIKYREIVKICAICIPMQFDGTKLGVIKQDVLKEFSSSDQIFIEYKIFTQFLYPLNTFKVTFISSLNKDGIVDVLATSGDFTKSGFSKKSSNLVVYNSMREDEFKSKYLNPIMD